LLEFEFFLPLVLGPTAKKNLSQTQIYPACSCKIFFGGQILFGANFFGLPNLFFGDQILFEWQKFLGEVKSLGWPNISA